MLEEEYPPRRVLPRHLRRQEPPEAPFSYSVRDARREDLPHLRELYNNYVANSVVTFADDATTLREWADKYAYAQKLGMPFLVAVSPNGQILGYATVTPWTQKAASRKIVEISIYLGAAARGKGLGTGLLGELITRSKEAGIIQMLAIIADKGAEASIRLHQKHGFKEVSRMGHVGYKYDRWLGTVLMQKSLRDPWRPFARHR